MIGGIIKHEGLLKTIIIGDVENVQIARMEYTITIIKDIYKERYQDI